MFRFITLVNFFLCVVGISALNAQRVSHTPVHEDMVSIFYYGGSLSKEHPNEISASFFQSFNSTFPYGYNDFGLWQSRYYNSSMQLAWRVRFNNLRFLLNPTVHFSQNSDFEILPPDPWSDSEYGYYESGIDSPQRYGSDAFFYFSAGNSVMRFLSDHWTMSVGTEKNWLGPGRYTQLLSGINSDGYPRIDLGIYDIIILNTRFEMFYWFGGLQGTEYNIRSKDRLFDDTINGIYFGFQPLFFPGLSIGFTKTSQTAIENFDLVSIFGALDFSVFNFSDFGVDYSDGKANLMIKWQSSDKSVEVYTEILKEDYHPSIRELFLLPEHTTAYSLGTSFLLPWNNRWRLDFEHVHLDWSVDYMYNGLTWGGGFYRHHRTNLGYTHNGQILGSWTGSNSNMQMIRLENNRESSITGVFVERFRPDNTFLFTDAETGTAGTKLRLTLPLILTFGIDYASSYNRVEYALELSANYYMNYLRIRDNDKLNIHLECSLKF